MGGGGAWSEMTGDELDLGLISTVSYLDYSLVIVKF